MTDEHRYTTKCSRIRAPWRPHFTQDVIEEAELYHLSPYCDHPTGRSFPILKQLAHILSVIICLLDSLLLLIPRDPQGGEKKKVLILRMDAIGDFILWLDAAKGLRSLYPEETHHLTLMANALWAPLAEMLLYFNEILPVEGMKFRLNLLYRWRHMFRIRRAAYAVVIQPAFSREFAFGDAVARVSGAAERIGSVGDCARTPPWLKWISDRWYTRLIPAATHPCMELEGNAGFMRGLGVAGFKATLPKLNIIRRFAIPSSDYFVIAPGAGKRFRQWPAECFKEIAAKLHSATGWHAVVCGGAGENYLGTKIADQATVPIVDYIGKTNLLELIDLIGGARMIVANETSAVHIAAAVSTPCISILGGGHYGRFLPYAIESAVDGPLPMAVTHPMDCFGCNWDCIYGVLRERPAPCIDKISVDDVLKVIEQAIRMP